MLSRLINAFSSTRTPSALLVVGNLGATIHVLHLLPEDGTVERFSLTSPSSNTTFRHHDACEQGREQLGAVTLHVGDGENASLFLDDVEARTRKLWDDLSSSSQGQPLAGGVEVTQLAQDVLRPAALDAIREREGREPSVNATQTYPVYVIYVNRSKPGRILPSEPTSF